MALDQGQRKTVFVAQHERENLALVQLRQGIALPCRRLRLDMRPEPVASFIVQAVATEDGAIGVASQFLAEITARDGNFPLDAALASRECSIFD